MEINIKQIAEEVFESLKGDIAREVDKRIHRVRPPFEAGVSDKSSSLETKDEPDGLGFDDFERAALNACDMIFKGKTVEQLAAAIEACRQDPDRFMRGVKVDMIA